MRAVRRPGAYVCGLDAAMDVIGGKWKVLILWELKETTRRFGELRRLVPGVTEKVLAAHLRELEADGIVRRTVHDQVPPRVEYALTPRGVALNEALAPLGDWGAAHVLGEAPAADPEFSRPSAADAALPTLGLVSANLELQPERPR